MADQPLAGRVAAITGASSGIGEATAIALSAAGAAVALGARRRDRLEQLAARLEGPCSVHEVDVTNEVQARGFVEAAHREHGGLHVLVNNAGVMLLGPVDGAPTSEWRRMLEVNLWGLLICTHAALPLIAGSGGGDVVNVSSVAGRRAMRDSAVYNATKFAVNAFTESLRQEVTARHVRVSAIEPGAVATELSSHLRDGIREQVQASFDFDRLTSDDIADAIAYVVTRARHVAINEVLIRPTEQVR
jgi:NADP-dependent 3-hydroxy acid dehydrogenase YdfG